MGNVIRSTYCSGCGKHPMKILVRQKTEQYIETPEVDPAKLFIPPGEPIEVSYEYEVKERVIAQYCCYCIIARENITIGGGAP